MEEDFREAVKRISDAMITLACGHTYARKFYSGGPCYACTHPPANVSKTGKNMPHPEELEREFRALEKKLREESDRPVRTFRGRGK